MLQTNSFTSVQHNFSNGIPLGADLIDEKTWNSLSSGAQQVILELSKTSVEYMSTAIDTAMSGGSNFSYEWKEFTLKTIQQENKESELIDKQNELVTLHFL